MGWLENFKRKRAVKARFNDLNSQGLFKGSADKRAVATLLVVLSGAVVTTTKLDEALAQSEASVNEVADSINHTGIDSDQLIRNEIDLLDARAQKLPDLEKRYLREAIKRHFSKASKDSISARIDLVSNILSELEGATSTLDSELKGYLVELQRLRDQSSPPTPEQIGQIIIGIEESLGYWSREAQRPNLKINDLMEALDVVYGEIILLREAGAGKELIRRLTGQYNREMNALKEVIKLNDKFTKGSSKLMLRLVPDTRSIRQREEAVREARTKQAEKYSKQSGNR